ncbi:hypothetical protein KEM56_007738 [Ascosphaera pollenicola]|nr:hypothetical protein KEM56_007738 [Ascosphaera pollenicola]
MPAAPTQRSPASIPPPPRQFGSMSSVTSGGHAPAPAGTSYANATNLPAWNDLPEDATKKATGPRRTTPSAVASPYAPAPAVGMGMGMGTLAASVPPNGSGFGSGLATATTETAGAAATSCSWGPRMWKLIDDQMTLNECSIYSYSPEEDPYEGDEGEEDGAIWSLKYFFFNKNRKRVCYLYLKGISVLSGSYREHRLAQGIHIGGTAAANAMGRRGYAFEDSGFDTSEAEDREKDNEDSVKKKARYWLGEYAAIKMRRNIDSDDDSDFADDDDDEEEGEKRGATRQPQVVDGDVEMILDDDEEEERQGPRTRQMVRERELARKKSQGARNGGDRGQRRRSRSPRGSKSSGGVSEQMAGMMEV